MFTWELFLETHLSRKCVLGFWMKILILKSKDGWIELVNFSGSGNLQLRLWFPNCWGWAQVLPSQREMVRLVQLVPCLE